jgi:hypothetical protein
MKMALILQGWQRRFLGLSAGVLLCASVGCQNNKEERRPVLSQGSKPMGPGNTAMSPPVSPAWSNVAGNGPANSPAGNGTPVGPTLQTGNSAMQNIQLPTNNQPANPTAFGHPPAQPVNGANAPIAMPISGQPQALPIDDFPQQGLPINNVPKPGYSPNGYPANPQNFPAPSMPMPNAQGVPQQPMLPGPTNNPPLSSNGFHDVKAPEPLPASVTNKEPDLLAPTLVLPAADMQKLTTPGEPPNLKVLYSSADRKPAPVEVKSGTLQPNDEPVVPAPVTVIK